MGRDMKGALITIVAMLVAGCGGVVAKSSVAKNAPFYPVNTGNICLFAGSPPPDVKYEVLGKIQATRRSYGSTEGLYPLMAYEGRQLGADAIIDIQASQRVKGPLPWRVMAPTGSGQAIGVLPDSPKIDCLAARGRLWSSSGRELTTAAQEIEANTARLPNENTSTNSTDTDGTDSERDLYAELMKLDELRKKGILTEAEFEAQKKKILEGD